MMICKNCNLSMNWVMSFSNEKHEKFCRCPKCHSETGRQKIKDSELVFGEVLNKEIYKRK